MPENTHDDERERACYSVGPSHCALFITLIEVLVLDHLQATHPDWSVKVLFYTTLVWLCAFTRCVGSPQSLGGLITTSHFVRAIVYLFVALARAFQCDLETNTSRAYYTCLNIPDLLMVGYLVHTMALIATLWWRISHAEFQPLDTL